MPRHSLPRSAAIAAPLDEQYSAWVTYVDQQIQMVLRGEIDARASDSWALRKAVRIGAPLDVIRQLSVQSDNTANSYEAIRYALSDPNGPAVLKAVLSGSPMPLSFDLFVWAAAAGNWLEMDGQMSPLGYDVAEPVLLAADVPVSVLHPAWRSRVLRGRPYDLLKHMTRVWAADDLDNILVIDTVDVRRPGTVLDTALAAAQPMSSWVPSRDPAGTDYAEDGGVLLAARLSSLTHIGSGAYGVVLSAWDAVLEKQVAVKITTIRNPANGLVELNPRRELRMALAMTNSATFQRSHPISPRLLDWTRLRLDMRRLSPLYTGYRGVGIYQVMVLEAFDFTLHAWLSQRTMLVLAPGVATAWHAILLAQMLTLFREFGVIHNDVRSDNVMLWDIRERPVPLRNGLVTDVAITGTRRLRLRPSQVGELVPSLIDFGLAIRPTDRDNDDLRQVFSLLKDSLRPAWVVQEGRAPAGKATALEGTIVSLFERVPELAALLS